MSTPAPIVNVTGSSPRGNGVDLAAVGGVPPAPKFKPDLEKTAAYHNMTVVCWEILRNTASYLTPGGMSEEQVWNKLKQLNSQVLRFTITPEHFAEQVSKYTTLQIDMDEFKTNYENAQKPSPSSADVDMSGAGDSSSDEDFEAEEHLIKETQRMERAMNRNPTFAP